MRLPARAWPAIALLTLGAAAAFAQQVPGEEPALPEDRVTQAEIESGKQSMRAIQMAGLRMFTTPFNRLDGYGDGPLGADTRRPGGRPTLAGNGTFLRVNGLDAQTCLECHSIVSNATIPATLGVGGVGGSNSNAIIMPTTLDAGDQDRDAIAAMDGRFANPPFVFGAGGVELLALEMTQDLLALREQALAEPGVPVELIAKGVHFGTLVADAEGNVDASAVEGVDEDLVVRPFGRKGEFATIREFDLEALQFHFGMQPTEVVGEGVDADGDGVVDEARVGDLSALSIFVAMLEPPVQQKRNAAARAGFETFQRIGCAGCHVPSLETESRKLPRRSPEVRTDPAANVFLEIDLSRKPTKFSKNKIGGVTVPLFADLKRHDMGPGLAETFSLASDRRNREFTTARLWGIADSGPYLHDGRATTLSDAILAHGGEAQEARNGFAALSAAERGELLSFLRTLRTPHHPAQKLMRRARRRF